MAVNIQNNTFPDNMLICGIPGSGKSYHFEHTILPIIQQDSRPVIIVDYKSQYNIPSSIHINNLSGPKMLGEIMQGVYSKGRKPRILRIVAPKYDVDEMDYKIFSYLNNCKPKILVFEEFHFLAEDLVRKQLPPEMKKFFRTSLGEHNKGHTICAISQFSRDLPSKVLNTFQDGKLFYLPKKELYYLYDCRYLEENPDYVYDLISPYKSYQYYDIGAHLRGEPQPFSTESNGDIPDAQDIEPDE